MELFYLFFLSMLGSIIADKIISDADHMPQVNLWQQIDDMVLSPIQTQALYTPFFNQGKNALRDVRYRWQNATVPYEFDSEFNYNQRKLVEKVLQEEFTKTCVTFRPRRETDRDYVRITNWSGCHSKVGRVGGGQVLSLEIPNCLHPPVIAHEFLHALGLYHQHSATNRDDYVTVLWHNVVPGLEHNFEKYGSNDITDFGQTYDYNSIMHYHPNTFSMNGKPTLMSKNPRVHLTSAMKLSPIDVIKINKMYNCEKN